MSYEPKLPSPQIDPKKVADAILHAAENPTRDTKVGMMAKIDTAAFKFIPGVADKMAAKYVEKQQYDEPPRNPDGALYQPSERTHVVARTHGTGGKEPG